MKKSIFTLLQVIIFTLAFAQVPNNMSYQAVIRNNQNILVSNQAVGMRVSILQGSATGTAVYVETHTPTTNINGLATIEIGGGTPVTATFAAINWANGSYFVKTETDPNGGSNYSISGTSQLLSVPYALYAATSGNSVNSMPSGVYGNTIRHDGTNWLATGNLFNTGSNIGIGTTPNSSAILDVNSANKGLLIPRMNTSQRDLINQPVEGLIIYNLGCKNIQYFDGVNWINFNTHPSNIVGSLNTISGLSNVCSGGTTTFSVAPGTAITNYNWTIPSGSNVVSGQGTNIVSVNFGSNTGNVCVTGNNACSTIPSNTICKAITISPALTTAPVVNPVTNITDTSATLSWNTQSGLNYTFQVSTNPNFSSFYSSYNGNWFGASSPVDIRLQCNTTYYYRVAAKNQCDTIFSNTVSFSTPTAIQPTATAASLLGTNKFFANWNNGGGYQNTVSFFLDVSTSSTFNNFVTGYNNLSVPNTSSGFLVTGLNSLTTYYYRVRRTSTCGSSSYSNTISVTTN
jgi:hypothetical protein